MGGDDEALEAWQDQEDQYREKMKLEMGNAWRVLYRGSKFFLEEDGHEEYQPLVQKVSELHDVMNQMEAENPKRYNFFGLRRG